MFCTNCGNRIPEDAQFCTSCGAKVTKSSTEEQVTEPVAQVNASVTPQETQTKQKASDSAQIPPSSSSPAVPQQVPQHTKEMPPIAQPQVTAATAGAQGSCAQAVPVDGSARTKKIILGALIAIIVILIIVIVGLFSCSRKAVAIDSTNFPDERVREVMKVSLDIDGDGMLSPEEAQAVTGIAFTSSGVTFDMGSSATSNSISGNSSDSGKGGAGSASNGGFTAASESTTGDSISNIDDVVDSFFKHFPNLESFVCHDRNLTRMDLGKVTKLQYLDCYGTSVRTLDLSKNKNIVSMFCDDSVALTGLDSAGLYYRDLITSVADSSSTNSGPGPTKFEYDSMGRVTSGAGKTFTYDEYGRLSRAQDDSSVNPWYEEYWYNADGFLSEAKVFQPLDASAEPFGYEFDYDDKRRVTAFSREIFNSNVYSGTVEYSGDKIASMKVSDGSAGDRDAVLKMTTDNDGRITQIDCKGSTELADEGTYTFKYLPDGQCSNFNVDLTHGGISAGIEELSFTAKTTSADIPSSSSIQGKDYASNFTLDVSYETNDDGYVTKIVTPSSSRASILNGTTVSISYVKHVGKLEDLPAQRYVPVYRVGSSLSPIDSMLVHGTSDLYGSTGGVDFISVLEDGPIQITFLPTGIAPSLVSNPNEQKLADYLVEHWDEPFAPKNVAANTTASANSTSSTAADSARVINTEYFTFTMPESWVGEVGMQEEHHTNLGQTHEGGPNQELHWYFFDLTRITGQSIGDVMTILVTNDPTGELGETDVVGEFETSGGLKGYVCINPMFMDRGDFKKIILIADLLSGGQVKSDQANIPSAREENMKIIRAWLKQNVVPNIKAK